jgi:glycosyltransferase involved in cell wall biosynthesis
VRATPVVVHDDNAYATLDIVIPVYNEGVNIGRTLLEIHEKIRTPHRVWIVYDFEEDDTLPVARRWRERDPTVHLAKNRYGQGVLNAIRTGFDLVEDGVILVVMADLSDDLAVVDTMFAKIQEGYDIVCGSRYMRGGRQIGGPRLKKLLSWGAGISLRYLTGIPTHDVTNSFKMYTTRVLRHVEIESRGGFEIGMEILVKAHANGYRIAEVPSIWCDRTAGESRFRLWKWLPNYLRWYWRAMRNAWLCR